MKSLNFEHQVGVSRLLEHRLRPFETDLETFLDLLKGVTPTAKVLLGPILNFMIICENIRPITGP